MGRVFINRDFDLVEELRHAFETAMGRNWLEEFQHAREKVNEIIREIEKSTEVMIRAH